MSVASQPTEKIKLCCIITNDSIGKYEFSFLITVFSVVLIILFGTFKFRHPVRVKTTDKSIIEMFVIAFLMLEGTSC